MGGGVIIAAPSSGAGKTIVTLGVVGALARRGVAVRAAKSGPDYIDGRFLEAASGRPCVNLDAWAMGEARLRALAGGVGTLVVEGAMGLFDAAPDGRGATADLARVLRLPVVLVVDGARLAQSAGPLVAGFARHDPAVRVAGAILNRVGSDRHERLLRRAVEAEGVPVLGALPRREDLAHPSRHLGLVQAGERADLDAFLAGVAALVEARVDLGALHALAATADLPPRDGPPIRPPAQSIVMASDAAFSFAYPHLLAGWRAAGASVVTFSPLADDPVPLADLVYLPGGYPELHAGRLAGATRFLSSLRRAAETSDVYGECGGYMVLGEALVDSEGAAHPMAGLLPLATSFQQRRLHLGYRHLQARAGPLAGLWAAHEFHYATTLRAEGEPLFYAWDAEGTELPPIGLRRGRVAGSFAHLIERMA